MIKPLFKFVTMLLAFMVTSFILHYVFLRFGYLRAEFNLLIVTYTFNFVLTSVFFGLLLFYSKKRNDQLGFIFMFSSLAKIMLFFLLLKPFLQTDEISKSISFWAFFVPYAISLTLECIALVRVLKKT
jgi:hypothetical protein